MIEKAREMFKKIKESLENENFKENVHEFQKAIKLLLEKYDTADRENRFVVGGALEELFCALLNSVGFICRRLCEERYDIDISNVKFSLKSSFTGEGDIRLINVLGRGQAEWREPTIFFIAGTGICYVDPQMGIPTRSTSDALVIRVEDIKQLLKKSGEWLVHVDIPLKPKFHTAGKRASYDVAKSILDEIGSKHLKPYLSSPLFSEDFDSRKEANHPNNFYT